MSHARRVVKGQTLSVVVRCSEQRYFLKPSRSLNRSLRFLLAHYAKKHGFLVHGLTVMANHLHLVCTDLYGALPRFMGELLALITRVVNCPLHRNRRGRLWEAQPYTAWPLQTQEEVLQQLVYLATNPVEAGVVKDPARWPGLISLPSHIGVPQLCKPPTGGLFGRGHEGSALPTSATLTFTVPPIFQDPDPKQQNDPAHQAKELARFRRLFADALEAALQEIHARIAHFKGRASVARLDPFSRPNTARRAPSFSLIPALTNASKEQRQELTAWRRAHREAFYAWQAGKNPVFPPGTYLMVHRYKARVASG